MNETSTKHHRGIPASEDLLTIWVILAVVAATAGVTLWVLRV
jgi:hypothetical protein